MTSLINPFTVMITFALFLIILGWFKPQITRIIVGCFFLIMAFIVNLPLAINNPSMFVEAGRNALFPIYQWFFTVIIAWNPPVFIYPLIVFESLVGLLILSKGRSVRYGLVLASLFCIFIAPIGIEAITSPVLGLAFALLLRADYPRSITEMVVNIFGKTRTQVASNNPGM